MGGDAALWLCGNIIQTRSSVGILYRVALLMIVLVDRLLILVAVSLCGILRDVTELLGG